MRSRVVLVVLVCLAAVLPALPARADAPSPEPFGSFGSMVDSLYPDLTGVAPTTAQRSAAVAALTAGTQTPGGLVAALRQSDDHVKNVDPVTRLYRAFLLRIPDKGGLEFWIKRRRTGTWTLTRIADTFASSNEFKTRYGPLSNEDFMKLIYDKVLERPYDASGLGYWTRQLDNKKKSRGTVMANFSESNEYKNKQAAEVTVSVLSVMLLRRSPTTSEFSTGVAAIEGGQTTTAYATGLIGRAEYAARFNAPLVIATPSLTTLYVGVPMQTVLTATGGFGTPTWSATGLPSWATLDPTTGTLSGTPTSAATHNATVTVTAGGGMTGTRTVALAVKAGMPAGCVTSDCAQLDTPAGTIQVPAAAVTSVTRASGSATSVALTAAAPAIANGNILVIAPGTNTPTGLIVKVTSFTGANGAARTVAVTPSTLTDAYSNGIVNGTGTPEPTAAAATTHASGCSASANIDITPSATVGLQPHVTLLWGKNVAGFGDVFVGTGGVKLFQFGLEGDLSFKLKGSMTGSVDCTLDVPGVTVPISLGPAGFLFFKLTPNLGLKATAGIEIDTTVTVHCGLVYAYQEGSEFRSQYCRPSYTAPKVSTANTGADLTVSGGVTASLTFNELVGLNGTLTASAHAGYHPLAHPIGVLDGKVTANLSACLACAFGSGAPSLTILNATLWQKTFATWDTPSPAPTFPLTITTSSLPSGKVGEAYNATLTATGGAKPYSWGATGLPAGLSINAAAGSISGTPTSSGASSAVITVTPQAGSSATRTLSLTIEPPPAGTLQHLSIGAATESISLSPDGRSLAAVNWRTGDITTIDLATRQSSSLGHVHTGFPFIRDGGRLFVQEAAEIWMKGVGQDWTKVHGGDDQYLAHVGIDRSGRWISFVGSGPLGNFNLLDRQTGQIDLLAGGAPLPDASGVYPENNRGMVADGGRVFYAFLYGKNFLRDTDAQVPVDWTLTWRVRTPPGTIRDIAVQSCTAPANDPYNCPLDVGGALATSPSGRYIVWSSDVVHWMDLQTGSQAQISNVTDELFVADTGRVLARSSTTGALITVDPNGVRSTVVDQILSNNDYDLSADGKRVIFAGQIQGGQADQVYLIDLAA